MATRRFHRLSEAENAEHKKSCGVGGIQMDLNSTKMYEMWDNYREEDNLPPIKKRLTVPPFPRIGSWLPLTPRQPSGDQSGILPNNETDAESQFKLSFAVSAKQRQLPWALKLYVMHYRESERFVNACSATLISYRHAITATKCLLLDDRKMQDVPIKHRVVALGGSPCVYMKGLFFVAQKKCVGNETAPSVLLMKSALIPESSFLMHLAKIKGLLHAVRYGSIVILELVKPADPAIFTPICIPIPTAALPTYAITYAYGRPDAIKSVKEVTQLRWYISERSVPTEWMCQSMYRRHNCRRFIITVNPTDVHGSICQGDAGGGLSITDQSKHYLIGVIEGRERYCGKNPQASYFETWHTSMLYYGDFLCYYTGICPLGYDKYNDASYVQHPEPVYYLSGKGRTAELVTSREQLLSQEHVVTQEGTGKSPTGYISAATTYQSETTVIIALSLIVM